jgi:hypothetical protein
MTTNVNKKLETAIFNNYLENAKLEVINDLSFAYRYEDANTIIDFYQDEVGENHLEEFAVNVGGAWITKLATDEQLKMMWDKLNATSLAFEVEEEDESINAGDWEQLNGQWIWNPQI